MVSAILHKLTEMLLLSYQYLHLQPTSNKTQEVSFIETNKGTKNPETKFTVSDHLLAFKFDDNISEHNRRKEKGIPKPKKITIAGGDIFLFFDDVLSGLKAMSDYIVFYKFQEKSQEAQESQEHLFCFLINLKSKDTGNNGQQMVAAKIFAEFLYAHIKRFISPTPNLHFIKILSKSPSSTLNQTRRKKTTKIADYTDITIFREEKRDFDNFCKGYFRQIRTTNF